MKRQVEAIIPTAWGKFKMLAYAEDETDKMPHLALIHEDCDFSQPVLIRIHSECLTGDLFTSRRCDCGEQLDKAMRMAFEQKGMLIYLRQEGRGIGLINKLKAYNLQDDGLNTIDANTHMGFEPDARHYDAAIDILKDLGISTVRLMTNNPLKLDALENSKIKVLERVPIVIQAREENEGYLNTKRDLMGHIFNWIK